MTYFNKLLLSSSVILSIASTSFSGEKVLWQDEKWNTTISKAALLNKVPNAIKKTGYAGVLPVCEVNGKNYILLSEEGDFHTGQPTGNYCEAGGTVDPGETNMQAALREFYEETSRVYDFRRKTGDFIKNSRICYNETNNVTIAYLDVDHIPRQVFMNAMNAERAKTVPGFNNVHFHEKTDFIWVDLKSLHDSVQGLAAGLNNPKVNISVLNDDGSISKKTIALRGTDFFAKTIKNSAPLFTSKYFKPKGATATVSPNLIPMNPGKVEAKTWTKNISKMIDYHFKTPYNIHNHTEKRKIGGVDYTVNRPNHSLAHGVRQGLLAVDVIDGLEAMSKKGLGIFGSQEAHDFMTWINGKIASDPYFKQKVELASAFQRTGRESEVSSSSDLNLYSSYERNDALNFDYYVQKNYIGPNSLFKDKAEAQVYKESILWTTAAEGKIDPATNKDLFYLRKLLHAAHLLDLRRLTSFDLNRMKCSVVEELFGPTLVNKANWTINAPFNAEEDFVNKLWKRSGEYLNATGDRNIGDSLGDAKKNHYSDRFLTLTQDNQQMAEVLQNAKIGSAVKF